MKTYRGYYIQVAPLSGRTEIFDPRDGALIDTQPTEGDAKRVIDEWLNAR